jgi:hypothetical protein
MLATTALCKIRRHYYHMLDSIIPYLRIRWCVTLLLACGYWIRCMGMSYDIITYLLGFYFVQLLVKYFTPKGLEEPLEEDVDER